MIRKLIAALAVPAAAAAITLTGGAASASVVPGPNVGVHLSSTPTLTLAAPNHIVSGKAAVLKTCLNPLGGNCSVQANLKNSEIFNFLATGSTGLEIRLHGSNVGSFGGWCLTSRGGAPAAAWFEECKNFASQRWTGDDGAVNTGPVVITNVKTALNLGPTLVAPYFPLQATAQHPRWSNSS